MNQKQLDDLEAKEDEDFSEDEFADLEDLKEDPQDSEEKMNDVDEIINSKESKNKNKSKEAKKKTKEFKTHETVKETHETKETFEEPKKENLSWDEEEEKKGGSAWKIISSILLLLLLVSIFTNGFNFSSASLSKADAEKKILDYINQNLLQPPFTATVNSSEELPNLFKVNILVAGQAVDTYITKDGKFFFPQGFDLTKSLTAGKTGTGNTETGAPVDLKIEADDPVKGDKDAPVTIIEFSDFSCPYCAAVNGNNQLVIDSLKSSNPSWVAPVPKIMADYVKTGKVKLVFKYFPGHGTGVEAMKLALCANEQGKFWELHDAFFANQDQLQNVAQLKDLASKAGVDITLLNKCYDDGKYDDKLEQDFAEGKTAGVSGTPAFFINGELITGAQSYSVFKDAIDSALEASITAPDANTNTQTQETAKPSETSAVPTAPSVNTANTPSITETVAPEVKEIKIDAKKYRFFDPRNPEKLNLAYAVNKGDNVKITVTSTDIQHTFELPEFQISKVIPAQGTITAEFKADKVGTFTFYSKSSVAMTGTLTVR